MDEILEEITVWYNGWKSFIPEQIRETKEMQELFKIAIVMIE